MKIFKQTPKEGMPVSHKTILDGLLAMARAWEELTITNGSITWTQGVPVIEAGGGGIFDYPGRVYKDADGNINVSGIRLNFWNGDSWNSDWKWEAGGSEWGALEDEYIYIRLDISSGSPDWTLDYSYTNPLENDSQTQRTWILADIDLGGTITQHWMGAIYETMGG